jgi:hypothetical protein
MSRARVECSRTRWQDRPACILRNEIVELTHLTGGGPIPDFHFLDAPALNPFWVPRWPLRDPMLFRPVRDVAAFGAAPVGRLLSGIAGHTVCLGTFGMPSDEEIRAGAVLHGEAGVRRWSASLHAGSRQGEMRFSLRLPRTGLAFSRVLSLRTSESVVRVRETVSNLLAADQFIQWQQHAVLGPPFLHPQDCVVTMPGRQGITAGGDYEGHPALAPSAEYSWPHAPGIDGGLVDLRRPCQSPGTGFVAGIQLDPGREHAFVCAVNRAHRLAIGYLFRRSQFPWVTLWEENRARTTPPWRGREQARAFEFGVSPLPVGRQAMLRMGEKFGTPVILRLPALGSVAAAWVLFLGRMPATVERVHDIQLRPDRLCVTTNRRTAITIPASDIAEFLG